MREIKLFFYFFIFLFFLSQGVFARAAPILCPVTQGEISQALYFTGVIEPIHNVPVVSPTAGVVDQRYVVNGERVIKGQKLLHVDTTALMDSIRAAQVSYLNAVANQIKAHQSLLAVQNTYQENKTLYQYGVISHDALVQSQEALEQAQGLQNTPNQNSQSSALRIATLQLENAQQKYEALLSQQKNSTLIAPVSGIVLKPPAVAASASNGAASSDGQPVTVGSRIRYQQVVMGIGDMSGLKVKLSVPENAVNLLKLHQAATLTSPGFPGLTLKGEVTEIGAEANSAGDGSGVANFPVTVEVPHISEASPGPTEIDSIRAGMDAQVKVVIYHATDQLSIPIAAVQQTGSGQSEVWVLNPHTHATEPRMITTGTVLLARVQVLKGLSPHDQVVCAHS